MVVSTFLCCQLEQLNILLRTQFRIFCILYRHRYITYKWNIIWYLSNAQKNLSINSGLMWAKCFRLKYISLVYRFPEGFKMLKYLSFDPLIHRRVFTKLEVISTIFREISDGNDPLHKTFCLESEKHFMFNLLVVYFCCI